MRRRGDIEPVTVEPLRPVDRPVMRSSWTELSYLHWAYAPQVVQRLLPDGLTVDTVVGEDGTEIAWVGLVPFRIGVGLPFGGPFLRFPETNVRTYVVGPDGGRGVYFFSLDATNLAGVVTARTTYRIPYFWADMAIEHEGRATADHTVTYRCRRRWPNPGRGALSLVRIRVGERLDDHEASPLDHFLSARWSLYAPWGDRITRGHMDHERWPLARAELLELDDELVEAAGLPAPAGAPLVRYAEEVTVRVARPRIARERDGSDDAFSSGR